MPDTTTNGWKIVCSAALAATVLWFGEALVGLTPLFGHSLVEAFSMHVVQQAICTPPVDGHSTGTTLTNCRAIPETPFAEICVLAVVTSGLSLLPSFHFGEHGRRAPRTMFTYLLSLATLGALICGAILYALYATGIGQNAEKATYYNLAGALFGSFALTLERGILEANLMARREYASTLESNTRTDISSENVPLSESRGTAT